MSMNHQEKIQPGGGHDSKQMFRYERDSIIPTRHCCNEQRATYISLKACRSIYSTTESHVDLTIAVPTQVIAGKVISLTYQADK